MVSTSDLTDLATGGLAKMMASSVDPTKQQFTDLNTTITIVVIIVVILYILLTIAVYKLTDSGLQALLFLIFGGVYMAIALIYYGFSGYKIIKRS